MIGPVHVFGIIHPKVMGAFIKCLALFILKINGFIPTLQAWLKRHIEGLFFKAIFKKQPFNPYLLI
jgi:hypothetical protein